MAPAAAARRAVNLAARRWQHRREIARLRDAPWADPAAMDALRLRRLRQTLDRARKASPFYGERLRHAPQVESLDDVRGLSITVKQDLLSAGVDRAAPGSRLRRRVTWQTSGSSGEPYRFAVDAYYFDRHCAQRAFVYLQAGVTPGATVAEVLGYSRHLPPDRSYPTFDRWLLGYAAGGLTDKVREVAPQLLYGNRSHLLQVAEEVAASGIELHVPYVCSSSETLLPGDEARLREVLGAQVLEIYGSAEASNVAYRLPGSERWVVLEPRVLVEVLDEDREPVAPGRVGELVLTTLTEPTAPLIRYATGDLACVASGGGGGSGMAFAALEGRLSDVLRTADGSRARDWSNRFWATAAIAPHVRRWRLHQAADRSVHIQLELATGGSVEAVEEAIVDYVRSGLGGVPVVVEACDRVHDPAQGKFRAVTSDAS